MKITNLTSPGVDPVDGDFIRIEHDGGSVEERHFFAPVEPQAPIPSRVLTHLQYMGRFTDDELRAIYTAAKTIVDVEIWLDKFKMAQEVNLDDTKTIAGLQAMEDAGLLVAGRAAEILA